MKKLKKIGLPALFCVLTAFFTFGVQKWFKVVSDKPIYQMQTGFYKEKRNSLDAVYVGASHVYAFWEAPVAWEEFGYAVYPYSIPGMPARAIRYVVEEAHKTQPDALYIVNLNGFRRQKYLESRIHFLVDYMPFSMTKLRLIHELTEANGISGFGKLEYYFPIIRFHSGWSELKTENIYHAPSELKAAASYETFLTRCKDISKKYTVTDQREPINDVQRDVLDRFLSYCEEENIRVLFTVVPQAVNDEKALAQLNTLEDIVTERGFDVLNMEKLTEEMGLVLADDYDDLKHLNIHGALKYTHFLGQYLKDHYEFKNKKDDPAYESWNLAYSKYLSVIGPYTLDFERQHLERDYSLEAPGLLKCSASGEKMTLEWEKTENAEGYIIYRKNGTGGTWEAVAQKEADALSYEDYELASKTTYVYTVVPVRYEDDIVLYGNYVISGISGTTD